jgi:hypothetical protein
MNGILWIVTLGLLAAAAVVGYVIYVRAREGQQPGEALIEGLLNRVRREKKPADPPAHAEPPVVQQVPPGYGPDPVVPPPIANRPPPVPATVVLPVTPPSDEGIPMRPLSNADLFDPMPPGSTEYYGPMQKPYQLGDAVYALNQAAQYTQATGRSLFADLYTGSHAEVMWLWRDADANRNEQLPHDPALQGVIDSLVQQYRR